MFINLEILSQVLSFIIKKILYSIYGFIFAYLFFEKLLIYLIKIKYSDFNFKKENNQKKIKKKKDLKINKKKILELKYKHGALNLGEIKKDINLIIKTFEDFSNFFLQIIFFFGHNDYINLKLNLKILELENFDCNFKIFEKEIKEKKKIFCDFKKNLKFFEKDILVNLNKIFKEIFFEEEKINSNFKELSNILLKKKKEEFLIIYNETKILIKKSNDHLENKKNEICSMLNKVIFNISALLENNKNYKNLKKFKSENILIDSEKKNLKEKINIYEKEEKFDLEFSEIILGFDKFMLNTEKKFEEIFSKEKKNDKFFELKKISNFLNCYSTLLNKIQEKFSIFEKNIHIEKKNQFFEDLKNQILEIEKNIISFKNHFKILKKDKSIEKNEFLLFINLYDDIIQKSLFLIKFKNSFFIKDYSFIEKKDRKYSVKEKRIIFKKNFENEQLKIIHSLENLDFFQNNQNKKLQKNKNKKKILLNSQKEKKNLSQITDEEIDYDNLNIEIFLNKFLDICLQEWKVNNSFKIKMLKQLKKAFNQNKVEILSEIEVCDFVIDSKNLNLKNIKIIKNCLENKNMMFDADLVFRGKIKLVLKGKLLIDNTKFKNRFINEIDISIEIVIKEIFTIIRLFFEKSKLKKDFKDSNIINNGENLENSWFSFLEKPFVKYEIFPTIYNFSSFKLNFDHELFSVSDALIDIVFESVIFPNFVDFAIPLVD